MMVVGPLAAQALGLLGRRYLVADVFNHFVPIYCLLIALGLCGAWLSKQRAISFIGLCCLAITTARVLFYFVPTTHEEPSSPSLRILVVNVNYESRAFDETIALIEAGDDPDILVFPEFMERWDIALEPIEVTYPHILRTGVTAKNYGIAVYSKTPLAELDIDAWPILKHRAIVGSFEWESRKIQLVTVHPRSVHTERRDHHLAQMAAIAELARSLNGPTIVVGDFNSTPWSPNIHHILDSGKLRDVRGGFGLFPTWPVPLPVLPIDGCMVNSDFVVQDVLRGPDIGSDHYPLLVSIAFRE